MNFDAETVHGDKYLSTETKSVNDESRTGFHDDGLLTEQSLCTAHSLILTDSVYKIDKN